MSPRCAARRTRAVLRRGGDPADAAAATSAARRSMSDIDDLVRAACSSDPRPALALLQSRATISRHDIVTGCVAGDAECVAGALAGSPDAAHEPVGPFGWEPILYTTFS